MSAQKIIQPDELSWSFLQPLIENNISYLCLDWNTQQQVLPPHLLQNSLALKVIQSLHQLIVDSPLVHNYRPSLHGVLALSLGQTFIDFFELDYFDNSIEEGIFFHTFSRLGIVKSTSPR